MILGLRANLFDEEGNDVGVWCIHGLIKMGSRYERGCQGSSIEIQQTHREFKMKKSLKISFDKNVNLQEDVLS